MTVQPLKQAVPENFQGMADDHYENTLNGYLLISPNGTILKANGRFADWVGYTPGKIVGMRFSDLLSVGSKIHYETHLSPLMHMQGFFDEIAFELAGNEGRHLPVFANGMAHRDANQKIAFFRFTVFKGMDRHLYEETLRTARTLAETNLSDERESSALREQFIAVLGHDLRNPLGAIQGGINIMLSSPLNEQAMIMARMIQSCTERMGSLIENVMDFARGRLGGGLSLNREPALLAPIFMHVIDELRIKNVGRVMETEFNLPCIINCDARRLCQLLSNIASNALTHGAADGTVTVRAAITNDALVLSVHNTGNAIPPYALTRLFRPFTRDELKPHQQGLGLGLYIAYEIATAHAGTLSATSDDVETCFTFSMPIANA